MIMIGRGKWGMTMNVYESISALEEVFRYAKLYRSVPLAIVNRKVVTPLLSHDVDRDWFTLLELIEAKTLDWVHHSVAVGILASLIGKRMQLSSMDRQSLLTAGVLHDIGIVLIPSEILHQPDFNAEYWEVYENHTIFGYQLLKNTIGISHHQALVALEHHERVDGSGYPMKKSGEQMSLFSKIVGFADALCGYLESSEVPCGRVSLEQMMTMLPDTFFRSFDPMLVSVVMGVETS